MRLYIYVCVCVSSNNRKRNLVVGFTRGWVARPTPCPSVWENQKTRTYYNIRIDIVCVCVCVYSLLFATICPNYYCYDLISGLKSFLFSLRLSLSVFIFYLFIFFFISREGRVYGICSRSRVTTTTTIIIIIPVAISSPVPVQPLNDTGQAAVHRNICFCVTYPFGRRIYYSVDEEWKKKYIKKKHN